MQTPEIKARIRKRLLERRRAMSFEEVFRLSSMVQERFLCSKSFGSSQSIALYSSFANEVLTDDIFERASDEGKDVYYPRVVKGNGRLAFHRVGSLKDLSPGSFEVPEPPEAETRVTPGTLDLVVVPGVAFDTRGARLGFGMGYYDRVLKGLKARIVALAYEFQVLDTEIPVDGHDVSVSFIFTEERTIETGAAP